MEIQENTWLRSPEVLLHRAARSLFFCDLFLLFVWRVTQGWELRLNTISHRWRVLSSKFCSCFVSRCRAAIKVSLSALIVSMNQRLKKKKKSCAIKSFIFSERRTLTCMYQHPDAGSSSFFRRLSIFVFRSGSRLQVIVKLRPHFHRYLGGTLGGTLDQ